MILNPQLLEIANVYFAMDYYRKGRCLKHRFFVCLQGLSEIQPSEYGNDGHNYAGVTVSCLPVKGILFVVQFMNIIITHFCKYVPILETISCNHIVTHLPGLLIPV